MVKNHIVKFTSVTCANFKMPRGILLFIDKDDVSMIKNIPFISSLDICNFELILPDMVYSYRYQVGGEYKLVNMYKIYSLLPLSDCEFDLRSCLPAVHCYQKEKINKNYRKRS